MRLDHLLSKSNLKLLDYWFLTLLIFVLFILMPRPNYHFLIENDFLLSKIFIWACSSDG